MMIYIVDIPQVLRLAPSTTMQDVANALLPFYAVTLLFFAGFLIRFDNIPPWWKVRLQLGMDACQLQAGEAWLRRIIFAS